MATFDSKEHIDQFIKNGGWLDSCLPEDKEFPEPDNPPAIKIVEYKNAWGKITWGVVFEGDRNPDKYEVESPFVISPRVIWRRAEDFHDSSS